MSTGEKQPARLSTARTRELGEELRQAKQCAQVSSSGVVTALEWSLGKLSKPETGSRGTGIGDIATLLGHYGTDKATRDRVLAIAAEPDTGSFLRRHAPSADTLTAVTLHERTARTITTYSEKMRALADCALTADESREILAGWAEIYNARSAPPRSSRTEPGTPPRAVTGIRPGSGE